MRIGEANNEKDLVDALETARKRRLEFRRGFEALWWNNIALLAGDHHARWNPTLSRFEDRDVIPADLDQKKSKIVINLALAVARTELAKLTKTHPIMEVIANSDEETDIAATKVAKAGLDYAEWKFKLRKKRRDTYWWMIAAGMGALYVGWDYLNDNAGMIRFLIDPETGDATFHPDRQRELERQVADGVLDSLNYEEMPMGELDYKVYSPFQLLPDETSLDFDSINDLITTEVVDVDVLKGIYGAKVKNIMPEQVQLGTMERRMLMRMGGGAGEIDQQNSMPATGAYVHTFWLLPNVYRGNSLLKNGIYCRWTSDRKVLDCSKAFPYQDGRMPFGFFQHISSATSIWPDSVLSHIRGPNLEVDKIVSQLIENKDYMANPMWRVATQHRIKGKPKNVAGGVLRYVHSPNIPPPEPVQGLEMPRQVEDLLKILQESILEITGQSEVARGRVPTGVRSGVAVAYLQEEDDTKIAPTVDNIENAIAFTGSLTLERFAQFYQIERVVRFYRRDGSFDVVRFKGADLKNNTDVIVQAGSAMPKSKAAKQQYTLELISLGVLTDPHKIFEMLELGQGEPDNQDKSRQQADRENNIMRFGMPDEHFRFRPAHDDQSMQQYLAVAVPVKAWHNHQVHLDRHYSVMMEADFDKLQISHPYIPRLFDEHVAMHQQALEQQQQQQIQQMAALKGAPGGMPGGDGGPQPPGAPGAQPADQQGFNPDTFQTRSFIPDIIGGGNLQTSARRITPQPKT